ncbi:NADPH oxidase [Acrasis kona]|uniref:NADPH oxidase n=1 Tax=Acrasis kona TaxID=1008807 RepID=A0AAW2YQG0_9EUKA
MSKFKEFCGSFVDFFLYSCFDNGFTSGIYASCKRFIATWKSRFTDKDEFYNYVSAEGQKAFIVVVWICINIGLFIEACYRWYMVANRAVELNKRLGTPGWDSYIPWWVMIARGFGQLLNFNCALILLPTMRTLLNVLRSFKIGHILPLDKNIIFHRYLAYTIVVCTVGHTLAHYFNYSCCPMFYRNVYNQPETSTLVACWGNKYGLTGNLLVFVMVIMFSAATEAYRRSKNFTIFWYTHHLFIIFFGLLLIHGRNFWMWFFGPGAMYIVERILRNVRGSTVTIVKRVHALSARVIHLELEKPAFRYKSGQYCFLNCPIISRHEWHPFTISSAPEEEYLTFHIRCVGDWTNALMDLLNPAKRSTLVIDKNTTPDGKDHLLKVDGPFGTAAEYVFQFDTVMLVAAGIGVTPYASLLKHIKYRMQHDPNGLKIKKVYFYWINREEGSWEWFTELLNQIETDCPDQFEIHTYMTGDIKAQDVKAIMFGSSEASGVASPSDIVVTARCLYDYEPASSDELQLSEGDIIDVMDRDLSGWWTGVNKTTKAKGLFPNNYVVLLDKVTKLREGKNRHFGRPLWHEEFENVRKHVLNNTDPSKEKSKSRPKVGVFICGPSALSKQLYGFSVKESKAPSQVNFKFHKENF